MSFNSLPPPVASSADESGLQLDTRFNTLVISDLHLGEDLSPVATEASRLHVDIVERQLCAFLRHYTRRRDGGLPWRLVINGDLIDFLSVSIGPEHPEFAGHADGVTPDELVHGLHRTPRVAALAVAEVAMRHPDVFRALARFLARGNRVEIICGNHDAELCWREAQEAFRAQVAAAWRGEPGTPSGAELAATIRFHPWFYWEPGALWIEHGHQYDENCSFENQLDPRRPGGKEISVNVDSAGIRYVSNRVQGTDPHNHEAWSLLGYLRFGAGLGFRGCLQLARAYIRFNVALISAWKQNRATQAARDEQRARHLDRLGELASSWSIERETLMKVNELHRPPVTGHLRRLASVMMLDKVFFYAIGAIIALAALTLGLPYSGGIAVLALAAALVAGRWHARDRSVDAAAALELAGTRVLDRIDARYVIFGHTHEPVARPVGAEGKTYFNLGTWLPSGRPGMLRAFTHLVVRHRESGPVAELCQWRDGQSRAFTPGWRPAALAGAKVPELVGASEPVTLTARASRAR
jgi:UDP-2,3-diacylglucosamine pyrophosphatase LpxH